MPFVRFALVALFVPTAAMAAGLDERATGTFENKRGSYEQGVVVKADAAGGFTGEFSTGDRGCTGAVTMKGRAAGPSTIVFSKTESGETCRITARYASDFRSVALAEDNCVYWHGAACEFEGKLKRSRR